MPSQDTYCRKVWNLIQAMNIRMLWDGNQSKSRKQAVTAFRLETEHDYMAKHLHRFNNSPSYNCMLCRLPNTVIDSHHLTQYVALKDNDNRDTAALYWDAQRRMVRIPPTCCHWKREHGSRIGYETAINANYTEYKELKILHHMWRTLELHFKISITYRYFLFDCKLQPP